MTSPDRRSSFVVFEGLRGTGKTTIRDRVASTLQNDGYDVAVVDEFSNTSYGEQLRKYLSESYHAGEYYDFPLFDSEVDAVPNISLTSALSQLLDLSITIEYEILPALENNDFVLKDRFIHSSMVLEPLIYSSRYSNRDGFHTFVAQFAEVLPVVADETIYLEVEEDTRLERLAETNESIDPTYTDSWENIHEQFAAFPELTVINNDGSIEDTVQAVVSVLH